MKSKDEIIDEAAERNARLIIHLRHVTARLHKIVHNPNVGYTYCNEVDCKKTAELLKIPPRGF
jgi:hypothetical protein